MFLFENTNSDIDLFVVQIVITILKMTLYANVVTEFTSTIIVVILVVYVVCEGSTKISRSYTASKLL